ncbi:hypothetical protein Dsin_027321 [Dipteronia sinensis]|uniref:Uncharacterized protein n=1 Tax=Dipteronia sinensis TaxID=43782 RepID=A0AAD9ZP56_9ROSI|nr:hypothetical protein Dsin_027321 [Dipteronia sinensis]
MPHVGEGVHPQLNVFLVDQLRGHEPADTNTNKYPCSCHILHIQVFLEKCALLFNFRIGGNFHLVLVWYPFYHSKKFTGAGSSLFNFITVVKASWLKRHLPYPPSSENYFYGPNIHDHQKQTHLSPQVKILRWLDKAAIIEYSNLSDQQDQKKAGRLCTVEQVKETKLLLKMIPMWSTFLVIGLVLSTGDTFSSEQGDNLNAPIERVPKTQYKLAKILRIWIGMVICTIFCAVAWRVKVGRLQKKITNLFWLAPQYCLLGLMLGFSADGLDEFLIDELPESLRNYASAMNGFVIDGLGSFLSILIIHANRNIFGSTLDGSRLDKYYMRLMIISFLNVCYYYFISTIYSGPTPDPQAELVERDIHVAVEV